jgi:hypothetical protein
MHAPLYCNLLRFFMGPPGAFVEFLAVPLDTALEMAYFNAARPDFDSGIALASGESTAASLPNYA